MIFRDGAEVIMRHTSNKSNSSWDEDTFKLCEVDVIVEGTDLVDTIVC